MRFLALLFLSFQVYAGSVMDIIRQDDDLSTLRDLIEKAGLDEVLDSNHRLTVLAPTNDAFEKFDASQIALLESDPELLKQTLKYHLAVPTLTKKIIKVLNGVETLSGKYITKFGSKLETAQVVNYDHFAKNGVLHKIDTVLPYDKVSALNEIQPVNYVDLKQYAGLWYEIYRYPNSFERGCGSVTAEYSLNANGTVRVLNTCVRSNGFKKTSKATAFVTSSSNASLKVSFVPFFQRWGLFGGDYNILYLADNYDYVMVGSKDRNFLWFLSRSPELSQDELVLLRMQAISQGYDPDRMIKTPKY